LNLFRRKTGTNRFFAVKLVKKVRRLWQRVQGVDS
jgi:hypothetical protein